MVNLRVRGPSSACSLKLEQGATLGDLRQKLVEELSLTAPFDILTGFPPTACTLEDDVLVEGSFEDNDTIRVQLSALAGTQRQAKAGVVMKGSKKTATKSPVGKKKVESSPTLQPTFGARIATINSSSSSSSNSAFGGSKKKAFTIINNNATAAKKNVSSGGNSIKRTRRSLPASSKGNLQCIDYA